MFGKRNLNLGICFDCSDFLLKRFMPGPMPVILTQPFDCYMAVNTRFLFSTSPT